MALQPALQQQPRLAHLPKILMATGRVRPGLALLEGLSRSHGLATGHVDAADLDKAPRPLQGTNQGIALAPGNGVADQPMQRGHVAHRDGDPDRRHEVTCGLKALQGGAVLEQRLVNDSGARILTMATHGRSGDGVLTSGQQPTHLGLEHTVTGRRRCRRRCRRHRRRRRHAGPL